MQTEQKPKQKPISERVLSDRAVAEFKFAWMFAWGFMLGGVIVALLTVPWWWPVIVSLLMVISAALRIVVAVFREAR